ncbi:MAG: insulinase family protein [Akkermansiaceae bacterium]|jgi:zinc protease|nr:insulinase family protein [Akkermansiaceae bacterium]
MEFPATTANLEILPNGLTLILDPSPSAPVVSAQIWVETGSIHEGALLGAGLSHFLEHMVFKGGGDFGPAELAETVQAAGGHWNAYTTFDRTVYYIDGPSSGLDTFLRVLHAMVFHPHLPESEFEKEKDVIRREIDMGLDDPDDRAHRLLFETLFVRDARRQPVIGHRELFDRICYDDLRSYHRDRYTPDRACLCVSGDFDEDAVREAISSIYSGLTRGMATDPPCAAEPVQQSPRRARATFAVPTSRITLAWQTPPAGHADQAALDLAAAILGRGRSARLYRELREERELALEISAWHWSGSTGPGVFAVSAETDVAKRDELIAATQGLLGEFSSSALDDDLAKARRQIATSQFRTLLTASGRATDLASNWHEARDLNFTRHYLQQLQTVTACQLRQAMGRLLATAPTVTVLDPLGSPGFSRIDGRDVGKSDLETLTLESGAVVALIPDARVPLVTLQAAIRAGSPSETPATAGINRLLASCLPQGTVRHDAATLALMLESLGASLGASTGNNSMLVQLSGLSGDLETLVPLFADVLIRPSLDGAALEREKASQLAALRESEEDPLTVAFRQLRQQLFAGAGYAMPGLGTVESLERLDRLALSAHHSLHFRGPNLAIAIAGDFDPAVVKPLLAGALKDLHGGEAWQAPASLPGQAIEVVHELDKKQAVITLGLRSVGVHDPRRHALRFLQEWCSDMAGPLFTRIREELGLAYQVGATQFLGHDTGMFAFYVATDPSQATLAETELRAEIARLANEGIPDEAFERVRSTVLSATAIEQQSPGSVARHAAIDLLFGLPATHHREIAGIYQALSPDEVRRAAREILSQPLTVSRVMPPGSA